MLIIYFLKFFPVIIKVAKREQGEQERMWFIKSNALPAWAALGWLLYKTTFFPTFSCCPPSFETADKSIALKVLFFSWLLSVPLQIIKTQMYYTQDL